MSQCEEMVHPQGQPERLCRHEATIEMADGMYCTYHSRFHSEKLPEVPDIWEVLSQGIRGTLAELDMIEGHIHESRAGMQALLRKIEALWPRN